MAGAAMNDDAVDVSEQEFAVPRLVPRFSFIAEAEVTRTSDGMRLVARVSELSSHGCYVDTPDGFPVYTPLQLKIRYGGSVCELSGRVLYIHQGWGMGVLFGEIGEAQRIVLSSWLKELARKSAQRTGTGTQ
jgi:hypothetical protein